MKKKLLLTSLLSLYCLSKLLAQMPNLPTKATLGNTLLSSKTITSATQVDTVMYPRTLTDYTIEVKAKITSVTGRGLDIEGRNNAFQGFRVSLADTAFRWSTPLNALQSLSTPAAGQDQVIRIAVKNDSAYIFHNGAYIKVNPLTAINDIVNGVETSAGITKDSINLIAGWAGTATNNAGKPGDYGWGYTGTTVTNLFNTANGTSGVRYTDVNATVNTHTLDGNTYNGRLLFLRWDGNTTSGTVYNYPVVLEANTTYDFSLLHAYFSNATGARTITAGIGKTTGIAGRIASHQFVTSGTKTLKREEFVFTSQEAGTYYITINGDWGLFTVGELSLNKIIGGARLVIGKNYPNGAVNMQITSITCDDGAYAPTTLLTGALQNVTISGKVVSRIPATNTNFIVPGKTDFHLTGDYAPFINGTVALNSPDAWLFFDNVKPAVVLSKWMGNISINGAPAANNANVRVAIYKNGAVVIPEGNLVSARAMEIFTQPNLAGTTKQLEIQTYHNNLAAFDNKIRSFILRRGYMATVANNSDGSGYSRVFIANDSDLVVNNMPSGLDTSISFIRIFKWDWESKKGWAGGGTPVDQVNATWFYDWNIGGTPTADHNYVMIRQNGGWPSWEDIRAKQGVNSLSGFNEPDQAEQANMTVDQCIAQWPDMMKSGQRIGSPSPANPTSSWLSSFIGKCDELNYRVDYVTIHCYWNSLTPQGWYNRLKSIYDVVKRPLWITEWNNGANWTGESWPSDENAAFQKQLTDLKGILQVLDTTSFVERYAIYNWVENKRAMVLADTLTPAGKYYAANRSDLAFKTAQEFTHQWHLVAPRIDTSINADDFFKVTLSFKDLNGELGSKYILERLIDGRDTGYTAVSTYTGYAVSGTLTFTDSVYAKASYRVKAYNKAGTQFVSSAVMIVSRDLTPVAPVSLTGTVLSSTRISLSWNAGAYARAYNLKRSLNANGPFTTVLPRTRSFSFTDTALAAGTTYYYIVTSLNSAGESANSTVLQITTNDLVAPAAVMNPRAASGDAKAILTWDFIYDAKYEIARSTTLNGTYAVIATDVDALRFEDLNRTNGTAYYYKIAAYNAAGRSTQTTSLVATPVLGQHLHIGFNEATGTVAADDWGGYHATLFNNATWTNGKENTPGAVSLVKASSSYMQLASGVVSTINNFTIAAWIKLPANQGNNTRLFDFGNGTSTFMVFVPRTGTSVRYKITCATGTYDRYIPFEIPLDTWVHVAISQQGNIFKFYANGELKYSDSAATVKPADMGITTQNFLGRSQFSADAYSDHTYDDFRIYNYALSDQNINDLVNNNTLLVSARSVMNLDDTVKQKTNDNNASIQLYPNPARTYVKVAGLDSRVVNHYSLFSVSGNRIAAGIVKGGTIQLPANLPVGNYIVQITDRTRILATRQIIIIH
ncbi:glycosyl hydrolase [Filimonas effusa]|uniref:T9SS type A sorting domain-containing protein n=1 Tax=Filimonas effusa TaxID=2508721 RepID=A0A4Q1DBP4_9BACT|nr:glycosyl hydrolase [Filimonas effusa]RXK86013.1 T9SS type A sorting domain-containing protein [Filimonas effusa]